MYVFLQESCNFLNKDDQSYAVKRINQIELIKLIQNIYLNYKNQDIPHFLNRKDCIYDATLFET